MAENIPTGGQRADDDQVAVADLLHRINHKIRHVSRKSPREHDVTLGQIRALRQLRRCAEPIRMSELAEKLGIARRSATTVVDDLEETGLAVRTPDPNDRRATLVAITDAGLNVLTLAMEHRRAAAATVLASLSPDQLAGLRELLTLAASPDA